MAYTIGIDLGGTNIVGGLVDGQGKIVARRKRPTEAALGSDRVLGNIAEMVLQLMDDQGLQREDVTAIGAGIPGLIDPLNGICTFAGNLNWRNLDVANRLSTLTGIPAYIDNDVRMYVLGEAEAGAGRGFRTIFGLTLGTGVAAALVYNGQLYYGAGGIAGEIGHIRMDGVDATCGCGLTGCLETVASANGLARIARERIAAGETSILTELAPDLNALTSAHLSEAYDRGDRLAAEVFDYAGRLLGRGLSYAVTLLNPDGIVIGGGASNAGDRLFAPMREELQRLVLPMYWEQLTIRTAELQDDAGIIGSAVNAGRRLAAAAS